MCCRTAGEVKDLTNGGFPRYSPTGHLLFLDDDATLLAAPFDVERLELTGAAVPVAEGLGVLGNGTGFFAVSQTGTLVYHTGALGGSHTPLWVERDGTAREIDPGWSVPGSPTFSSLTLSPNEDRLAISIPDSEGTSDLWVKQLDAGPLSRLTFEGTQNIRANWSPDGQSMTFVSNRGGDYDLWTKRADGSGTAERVLDRESRNLGGVLLLGWYMVGLSGRSHCVCGHVRDGTWGGQCDGATGGDGLPVEVDRSLSRRSLAGLRLEQYGPR